MYTKPDQEKLDTQKIQRAIEICFPVQRKMINEETPVKEIQQEWPCLFGYNAMMVHFELLVGINLPNLLEKSCSAKVKAILNFFKVKGKHEALLAEVRQLQEEKNSNKFELPAMLLALLDHFGENRQRLFHSVDVNNHLSISKFFVLMFYVKCFMLNF